MDTRITLLMRVEGHSQEAVAEAIRQYGSISRGEEKRDWRRYAARTAGYAFDSQNILQLLARSSKERDEREQDDAGVYRRPLLPES